jgi:hypothetical protein
MPRSKKSARRPGRPQFIPDAPRNAAPAGARLRQQQLNDVPGFAQAHRIPQEVADAAAERKLTGGYRTTRSNTCKQCFQFRSANGSCGCRSKASDRKVRKLTQPHPISPYAGLI